MNPVVRRKSRRDAVNLFIRRPLRPGFTLRVERPGSASLNNQERKRAEHGEVSARVHVPESLVGMKSSGILVVAIAVVMMISKGTDVARV